MLRPPDEILSSFEALTQPLLRLSLDNRKQTQTLAQLRDALLPRLISGRLRMPEALQVLAAEKMAHPTL